jgi:hypothetical protein
LKNYLQRKDKEEIAPIESPCSSADELLEIIPPKHPKITIKFKGMKEAPKQTIFDLMNDILTNSSFESLMNLSRQLEKRDNFDLIFNGNGNDWNQEKFLELIQLLNSKCKNSELALISINIKMKLMCGLQICQENDVKMILDSLKQIMNDSSNQDSSLFANIISKLCRLITLKKFDENLQISVIYFCLDCLKNINTRAVYEAFSCLCAVFAAYPKHSKTILEEIVNIAISLNLSSVFRFNKINLVQNDSKYRILRISYLT